MKAHISSAKIFIICGLFSCISCLPVFAQFHSTGVFKVTLMLPAEMVVPGSNSDSIVKMTLNNTSIVNLALGRPMNTKVDPKKEILAVEATFELHTNPPQSQLIIYDSTQNGQAGVVAVVATLQTLDWQNAYENSLNTGFGVGTGFIHGTGLGNPSQNGFQKGSTFEGSGSGSGKHLFSVGDSNASPTGMATIQGHLNFLYTDSKGTHTFNGLIIGGTAHLSGKPIGGW